MQSSTVKKVNHIPLLIVFPIVLILGIIFMVLSFKVLAQKIPENYVKVEAEISFIDEININDEIEYQVYINYSFDSQDYLDKEYNKFDSSMKVGDKVTIYVNPDDANEFMSDKSDDFIFPIISGAFIIIGLVGTIYNIKMLVKLKRGE